MEKIFIGTSGWTFDHWRGTFYPEKLAKKRWFEFYAQHFNAIEINATFYRSFKENTYENWYNKAPEGFRYVLKVPRIITHIRYLKNVEQEITAFCDDAIQLKEKLALLLLQLHPNTRYDLQVLQQALCQFVNPKEVAVEFRSHKWFTPETLAVLEPLGAICCNLDSPIMKLSAYLTSSIAYFRLHGREEWYKHDYSDLELMELVNKVYEVKKKGAQEVYVFFNNDFYGHSPKNALRLKEMLGL